MFMKRMENYNQAGDLTDILRASGSGDSPPPEWQFTSGNQMNYPPNPPEDFGHPFIQIRDPLLHDIGSGFGEDEMKARPPNIFSKMMQISPSNAKLQMPPHQPPRGMLKGPMFLPNDQTLISSNGGSSSSLQISATSRNSGIKRRKIQAKKVVCIPAPAPVNSRPSGEVVPSDLWAWRKYGQKPIKGSPYPRGYYRCSSSKGCPARKQVERSRTDPNMLVITYTSEHNHPWPTQRNALAGSTRTHQPSKNNAAKNTSNSEQATKKQASPKQEHTELSIENEAIDTVVKEEIMDREFEMNDVDIDSEFLKSYKPAFLEGSEDSFFADLGEIEPDPALDLLFTQGFSGGDHDPENKALDPFSFYDWASGSNSTTTSCSEAKKNS